MVRPILQKKIRLCRASEHLSWGLTELGTPGWRPGPRRLSQHNAVLLWVFEGMLGTRLGPPCCAQAEPCRGASCKHYRRSAWSLLLQPNITAMSEQAFTPSSPQTTCSPPASASSHWGLRHHLLETSLPCLHSPFQSLDPQNLWV